MESLSFGFHGERLLDGLLQKCCILDFSSYSLRKMSVKKISGHDSQLHSVKWARWGVYWRTRSHLLAHENSLLTWLFWLLSEISTLILPWTIVEIWFRCILEHKSMSIKAIRLQEYFSTCRLNFCPRLTPKLWKIVYYRYW